MLIALPPSEGKTTPDQGPRLDLSSLFGADVLSEPRSALMEELSAVSSSDECADILGLGPSSIDDAAHNTRLSTSPCAPALEIFTGVLFDALDQRHQSDRWHELASQHLLIFSGLWGVLRSNDVIPNHRLSMTVSLPALGTVAGLWSQHLPKVLDSYVESTGTQCILDCRSAPYRKPWPGTSTEADLITVGAKKLNPATGKLQTVSHWAKHYRGLLTAEVLRARESGTLDACASTESVLEVAAGMKGVQDIEFIAPKQSTRGQKAGSATLILDAESL
ncbi:YaaA family protein [Actinomyces vulturis]|uniref:YaaA family protein n=1 Tax=Actinomyces vulturis TaxID=1857645 RepID=UPI00082DCD98|nr:peroxide stress protein YaaA [Actinomyces vulturis]